METRTLVGLKIRVGRDGKLHATLSFTIEAPGGFRYEHEKTVETTLAEVVAWVGGILG